MTAALTRRQTSSVRSKPGAITVLIVLAGVLAVFLFPARLLPGPFSAALRPGHSAAGQPGSAVDSSRYGPVLARGFRSLGDWGRSFLLEPKTAYPVVQTRTICRKPAALFAADFSSARKILESWISEPGASKAGAGPPSSQPVGIDARTGLDRSRRRGDAKPTESSLARTEKRGWEILCRR